MQDFSTQKYRVLQVNLRMRFKSFCSLTFLLILRFRGYLVMDSSHRCTAECLQNGQQCSGMRSPWQNHYSFVVLVSVLELRAK